MWWNWMASFAGLCAVSFCVINGLSGLSWELIVFFPKQRLKAVYLPLPFSIMLGHTVYSIIFPVLFVLLASSSELHQPSVTISTFLQGRRITTTVPHLLSRLPLFLIHRMVQAGKPTALPPSPAFPSIFFPLCALQLLIAPNTANFPLSSSISSKCSYISQTSVHHDEACLGL